MKTAGILACVLLCFAMTLQAVAQVTQPGQDKSKTPKPETFLLDNGLTVTLLENHKGKTVAVESFYPAGFLHEPAGKAHLSHVAEHMFILSATRSYKARESFELLQKKGLVNAETLATSAHYDYVLPSGDLELALQVESERMTSIDFSEDVLKTEIARCLQEIELVQRNPQAGLVKFGFAGLNQALRAGADVKTVSIGCGATALTLEDVREFHRQRYTPETARLIIVGDFEPQTARELVNRHFAGIPRGRQRDAVPELLKGDICAEWDARSDALYLIYPRDGKDSRERISLQLFAGCLAMRLMADKGLRTTAKVASCPCSCSPRPSRKRASTISALPSRKSCEGR
jgi:predicted Zn-dependent peptidase